MKNHPNITFGSYPSWSGQHYRTKVTFEGESEEEVSRARSDMEELNPIKFDPKPTENTWDKIQQFLHEQTSDSHMVEVVEGSLKVMEECFARCNFNIHARCLHVLLKVSPGECVRLLQWGQGLHCNAPPRARILSGSFNWNILLISRRNIEKQLQKHFPGKQLKSFYISEDKTFPELDQFLSSSVAAYNLNNSVFQGKHLSNVIDFLNIPTGPLKPGLGRMIAEDPSIQATVCCLTCQIVVSSKSFGLFMGSLCFLIMFFVKY